MNPSASDPIAHLSFLMSLEAVELICKRMLNLVLLVGEESFNTGGFRTWDGFKLIGSSDGLPSLWFLISVDKHDWVQTSDSQPIWRKQIAFGAVYFVPTFSNSKGSPEGTTQHLQRPQQSKQHQKTEKTGTIPAQQTESPTAGHQQLQHHQTTTPPEEANKASRLPSKQNGTTTPGLDRIQDLKALSMRYPATKGSHESCANQRQKAQPPHLHKTETNRSKTQTPTITVTTPPRSS
ncbi:hypothetical protein Ancab_038632 [Ancistrocladus abbreviatus]